MPNGEFCYRIVGLPRNLEANLGRLLYLFAETGCRATFFVLGHVVHRVQPLLRRAIAEGHEVASHGWSHEYVTNQTPDQFRADVVRGKDAIEQAIGRSVLGYRAPSFTITERTTWALDVLRETGFVYDSSVCPVRNFVYGIPDELPVPHRLRNGLVEFPLASWSFLGMRFMVGGGFYMRLYPVWLHRWLLVRRGVDAATVYYIHPWEWDTRSHNPWDVGIEHPRVSEGGWLMRWIMTHNRRTAFEKFRGLVQSARNPLVLGEVALNA